MSAPRLPSLRPAGGGAHLLRLVRNASLGLPTTSQAGAIWAARGVFTSARPARTDAVPLNVSFHRLPKVQQLIFQKDRQTKIHSRFTSNRSYGASAYAVAEPEPQTSHPAPAVFADRSPPAVPLRPSKTILHPPDWTEPPLQLQDLLSQPNVTPSQFRSTFAEAICEPFHLARVSTLQSIWAIWQDQAEMSTWAWLAGQLSHIPNLAEKAELETGLIPMAQAMNAYAMVQLQHVREARDILADTKRTKSKGGVWAALIQAMVWVRLDHPENAKRQIAIAVAQMAGSAKTEVRTAQTMEMLERAVAAFSRAERWDDLLDVVVDVGGSFRSLMLSTSSSKPMPAADERMAGLWLDILASVPDPAGWLSARLEGSNKDTRWMGALFLTALARRGGELDRCGPLLNLISVEGLPLPAGTAGRLLSSLMAADHDTAAQVATHLAVDLPSLPHSALSTLLEYSSRSHEALETRRVWASLTDRFQPTSRDKSNFLCVGLNLLNPSEATSQLRHFFGSESHPDALSLLLSAQVTENDLEGARATFDQLMAVRPSVHVVNKMLGLYTANANADAAVRLFDDMAEYGLAPTLHSYTSLISLFANTKDVENARNVFGLMEDSGIEPDGAAYSAVLNAEVEAGEWTAAAQRWNEIPPAMQDQPNILSVIIKAYILLSIPTQRIVDIFRRVDRPNSYLWALVMQSAVDNDDFPLAEQLLADMDSSLHPRSPRPAVYHFSILLHGYMQTGRRTEARATYESMLERSIIPSSVTYGMIMAAFQEIDGRSGLEQGMQFAASINLSARQLTGAPRGRGTGLENLYGPLVSMSGHAGRLGKAGEYVGMAAPEPTVPLYTRLMDAYRQAGQTDSVLAIWERAFELACSSTRTTASNVLGGVATSRIRDHVLCVPLSIALDSLAAAGRYVDVRRVWDSVQRAGFGFDAQNYNHYATALARTGDVDRAFSIVENVLLPRWDEVKARRVSAMRESAYGLLPPPTESPSVDDVPALPPTRGTNRRHEVRWGVSAINTEYGSRGFVGVETELLRHWRPSDVLWRPSLLTMSVLEHAYGQLQDAKRSAWIALGGFEEDGEVDDFRDGDGEGGEGEGGEGGEVTLPSFGHVPIRNVDGEVKRTTPRAVLFRLNRKYVKTVALVMFHRRKRVEKRQG